MSETIKDFAKILKSSNNIVFFGGAGVSTESGVKDYRSPDGLYNTVKEYGVSPEVILSHSFFFENTKVFYDFYKNYFITDAMPNDAHKSLALLEKKGKLKAVITQNIDGLHQMAGSQNVIELHGNANEFYCTNCGKTCDSVAAKKEILSDKIPLCNCGGIIKPKVVLYEEMLYDNVAENAMNYISYADMLIVGGTSLSVYPAASFVRLFKGQKLVLINKSKTDMDISADITIYDGIGKVFKKVMDFFNDCPV